MHNHRHSLPTATVPRRPIVFVLAAVLAALAWGRCCLGQQPKFDPVSGGVYRRAAAGLTMTVDTRWLDGPGYRPVRITFTPTAPPAADRMLTLELLYKGGHRANNCELLVTQDIEIPAGSGPVQTTVSVPQMRDFNRCMFNVLEDGRLLRPLCSRLMSHDRWPDTWATDWFPRVLFVSDGLPDTSALAAMLPTAEFYDNLPGRMMTASDELPMPTAMPLPTAMAMNPRDLTGRWIDYTTLDVICLSLDEVRLLAARRPEVFGAVMTWTSAGGNLWVYGIGADWRGLPELEKLAGLSAAKGKGPADPADPAGRGWTEPDKGLFGRPLDERSEERFSGPGITWRQMRRRRQESDEPEPPPPNPPDRPHFVYREYDMGLIVALDGDAQFPGTKWDWDWVLSATGENRWLWHMRHGVSMNQMNQDFWDFLIPGVGLAPVTEFRILITLFVLAIGPVNYLLLRRWRRLHLLVITIPASAAVLTAAMFGYAVLADGLGTRVRVRSATLLDQRRGQAVCWARLSYYAGLAPSDGLSFPADVAVLPLEHDPRDRYHRRRRRELIWDDDQWLAAGWLPSRTPTQYITVRSRRSDRGLGITGGKDRPDQLEIRNRLGVPIQGLLVRGKDGRFYWSAELSAGDTATAKATDPRKPLEWLQTTYRENLPAFPPGMDRRSYGNIFGMRRYPYYGRGMMLGTAPEPSQEAGRLEQTLKRFAAASTVGGPPMEPGSYVAIVRESPEVVLGTESAREEDSFHVIFGRW